MAKRKQEKKEALTPLELAKQSLQKKYGNIVATVPEYKFKTQQFVSSGIISLDTILGHGGFALGRIYEIFGEPSSGKSSLAFSVVKQAQQKNIKCCIVDAEHSLDPQLLEGMGIDLGQLYVVGCDTGEENLDAAETLIRSGELGVVVIDSVSALIPESEADSDIDSDFMGLLGRLMGKACRRLSVLASKTNTLVIFINQTRANLKPFGEDKVTTGGEALKFFSTGRIRVKGGLVKSSRFLDSNGVAIGHVCKFEIVKNKLFPPYRTCEALLIYGKGFDREWELAKLSVDLDLVTKSGAWYKKDGENLAQGELNFINLLKKDVGLKTDLENEVKSLLGLVDVE